MGRSGRRASLPADGAGVYRPAEAGPGPGSAAVMRSAAGGPAGAIDGSGRGAGAIAVKRPALSGENPVIASVTALRTVFCMCFASAFGPLQFLISSKCAIFTDVTDPQKHHSQIPFDIRPILLRDPRKRAGENDR